MSYTDGQATCKADKGWLAMPKTSEDVADINQICNLIEVIMKIIINWLSTLHLKFQHPADGLE